MMMASAELRWFSPGGAPPELVAVFGSGTSEEREDVYVPLPGCNSVGVKLRQETNKTKFEVKAMRPGSYEQHVATDLIGRVELWVKWSLEAPSRDLFGAAISDAQTVRVSKDRRLIKYSADVGSVRKVEGERPDAGCKVQLTYLGVQGRKWWSLGFEAFGPEEQIQGILLSTANLFFEEHDLASLLKATEQKSYPAWIASQSLGGEASLTEPRGTT